MPSGGIPWGTTTIDILTGIVRQEITWGQIGERTFGDLFFLPVRGGDSGNPVTVSVSPSTTCTSIAGTSSGLTGAWITIKGVGTCSVVAAQAGNADYLSASATQTFTVRSANQTLTFGTQAPVTYAPNLGVTLNPPAVSSSGLPVTYGSASPQVCTVDASNGRTTVLSAGSCILTASQTGSANYNAAMPVIQVLTIQKADQTISFGPQESRTFVANGTFGLSPVAASSSGLPISYTSSTPTVCAVSGTTVTMLSIGICTIVAGQEGDTNYRTATAVNVSFSLTLPQLLPGAPTGVSATSSDRRATVSFSPPAPNGGPPITIYTVTATPSGISASGAASPINIAGLTNGTSYTFTVVATNSVGPGAPSAPSNVVTPYTVPPPPTGVTAIFGSGEAHVSFIPPSSTGGAPIVGYIVTANPGGLSVFGNSLPITLTGLTSGVAYTFTAQALNAAGSSAPSEPAGLEATPLAPSGVIYNTRPTYTWTALPSASSYAIWVFEVGAGVIYEAYTPAQAGCASGTGTCAVTPTTPLPIGRNYRWGLMTKDAQGTSRWSPVAPFITVSLTPAGPPGTGYVPLPANLSGDGRSLFMWRSTSGAVYPWRHNGTTFVDTGVTFGPDPGWNLINSDGDYDGDGKGDLLWQRTDGAISIWLMNGTTIKSQSQFGPYPGWSFFSGNSDFNSDGKSDLVWLRNDGAVSLWLMNGGTFSSERTHGPFAGWSLLSATNDFDGDGKADLLWKKNTGAVSLWLMDGIHGKQVSPEYGPYPGWTVVSGSSDYNGDGKTDLTWENSNNAVSVWLMNGVSVSTQSVQFGPYAGWRLLAGDRDFDGDGKSDLLWQRSDGAASVWLMSGASMPALANISAAFLPPGSNWGLLGAHSDFNGDGKTDLVWQSASGAVSIGLANGIVPPTPVIFGPFPGWSHFSGRSIP